MPRSLFLLAVCCAPLLTACGDPFGPPRPDLAVNGPPGHPPGRPPRPETGRGYEGAPPVFPGMEGQSGPPMLPGLATETQSTQETRPQFAIPDASVSYGAPDTNGQQ